MKKKIVTILVVIAVVLVLGIGGALGFVWYRDNHIFVQGTAYPMDSQELDLRGKSLTKAEFEAIQSQIPDCKILWTVPFQGNSYSSDIQTIAVSSLTEGDVKELLKYFPELTEVDASQCTDYAILEYLKGQKETLKVSYTVQMGGNSFLPDTAELVLGPEDYTYEQLLENLKHLPSVTEVLLAMPRISQEQIQVLKQTYPGVSFRVTVELLGQEQDTEVTELDLTALTSEGVEELIEKLAWVPQLAKASLSSELPKEDVKKLMEAAPHVVFDYSFDFFGTTLSTAQEEVSLKNVKIGDENEGEIRLALDLMKNCKKMVLDNCHLSDEVLAKIREDYRQQTKVVWRVWFGEGSTLTDAQVIRAVYDLVDDNCHDLIYCEDAVFVDFGHNEWLDGCEFISGMVNLEYCIISGSPIKDLTPFANCKKLKFLELAFCDYLEDASPLASCESLEMLNISNTHIVDLSPLDNLPLTHLVARMYPSGGTRVSGEEQARFMAAQPECQSFFADKKNPYGEGWRYEADNKTYLPYYAKIREVMRYDDDPNIPNHTGWYLD